MKVMASRGAVAALTLLVAGVLAALSTILVDVARPAVATPLDAVGPAVVTPAAGPVAGEARSRALAAFSTIRAVLQHPRCQNCHIPGDAPLQFDDGRRHTQNVMRGPEGKGAAGLPCATCHGAANLPASYGEHMPPGAPDWHLPPPDRKMVFIGLSAGDLCATIKDPLRNGGRNLDALLTHVSSDKLVLWGWNPGLGRAPVSVPHDAFVAQFKIWLAGGAPCPDPS
jgi:hypothetical protein